MQGLRNASFMNEPTLLALETLLVIGLYLVKVGRHQDAWTLFGTTIRTAYSLELHRNPDLVRPVPRPDECSVRRRLWWLMLFTDNHLSVTLGKPLGISVIGDCPHPMPLTTDPVALRLGDITRELVTTQRRILESEALLSEDKISDATKTIVELWNTMPEVLRFHASWLDTEASLPEWPLDIISAGEYYPVNAGHSCNGSNR